MKGVRQVKGKEKGLLDWIGEKLGGQTVLGIVYGDGGAQFQCRCDCGHVHLLSCRSAIKSKPMGCFECCKQVSDGVFSRCAAITAAGMGCSVEALQDFARKVWPDAEWAG